MVCTTTYNYYSNSECDLPLPGNPPPLLPPASARTKEFLDRIVFIALRHSSRAEPVITVNLRERNEQSVDMICTFIPLRFLIEHALK